MILLLTLMTNSSSLETMKLITAFQKIENQCEKLTKHSFVFESQSTMFRDNKQLRSTKRFFRAISCGLDYMVSEYKSKECLPNDLLNVTCEGCVKEPWIHAYDSLGKTNSALSPNRDLSRTSLYSVKYLSLSTTGLGLSYTKYVSPLLAKEVVFSTKTVGLSPVLVCTFKPVEYSTEYFFSSDLSNIIRIHEYSDSHDVSIDISYDQSISKIVPSKFTINKKTSKNSYIEHITVYNVSEVVDCQLEFTPKSVFLSNGDRINYYIPNGDSLSAEVREFKNGRTFFYQPDNNSLVTLKNTPVANTKRDTKYFFIIVTLFTISITLFIFLLFLRRVRK